MTANEDDTLIYRFTDASIPPEYHRSYTITVTPGEVHLSINSYGDVLSEYSLSLKQNAYQEFIDSLLLLTISSHAEIFPEGCTGGTTDTLDIRIGNRAIQGYTYHCGGKVFGTLEGEVAAAVSLFSALVPNLKKKIGAS